MNSEHRLSSSHGCCIAARPLHTRCAIVNTQVGAEFARLGFSASRSFWMICSGASHASWSWVQILTDPPTISSSVVGCLISERTTVMVMSDAAGNQVDVAMVAMHAWDLHGARGAGMLTGWAARLEGRWAPVFTAPDVVGDDLVQVVERLVSLPTRQA